ncbi:peptidyl-prolyl cis-trans isomerase B [Pigmentiphaga litoralis]|uniref:peptidylprolyl isomerase n=1 Tax=Pigmentiphaga litoralis TaxID=516702 RepID=UPI001674C39C|nr:peptidylprolyl isomerase [Pigmentiphaga litoralis]GGX09664.1 peptidyl-prolyl cis-trans isomerase B [Pigmentiphaga litoralis]
MKTFLTAAAVTLAALAAPTGAALAGPQVALTTSAGVVVIELDDQKAPATTANFLHYVNAGHYNGTIFHRVIPNFMVQGGGFTADMGEKKTREPIRNEASNGLKNDKYTVSMARTSDPQSATAQFFINTADNAFLNYRAATASGYGYAVFGKVVQGKEVVDKISATPTTTRGPYSDNPVQPITIQKAEVLK